MKWVSVESGLPDYDIFVLLCLVREHYPYEVGYLDTSNRFYSTSGAPLYDVVCWSEITSPTDN